MRKFLAAVTAAVIMAATFATTAFAGQWTGNDQEGWKYQNDNGSYQTGWAWIDGNQDGVSESYFFYDDGKLAVNTVTPDGYTVNGDGKWIVDGVVQTQGDSNGASDGFAEFFIEDLSAIQGTWKYTAAYYPETQTYEEPATNSQLVINGNSGKFIVNGEVSDYPVYKFTEAGKLYAMLACADKYNLMSAREIYYDGANYIALVEDILMLISNDFTLLFEKK